MPLADAIRALASALLIGILVGAQRETRLSHHPGLRDFVLIAGVGGVCGLLGSPVIAAGALLSIMFAMITLHFEARKLRRGVTTELAAVAAFGLSYFAAASPLPFAQPVAIAVTLIVVVFLEAKQYLQKMARETITESEFNATLGFVAVVLVVYPLLPTGHYGPYQFFSPRQVWMFVILRRCPHRKAEPIPMKPGNPFRLKPALRFGVMFTIVVFLAKAATSLLGPGAFFGTSLLGGLVDVATVIAPASDLLGANKITLGVAELAVLLALLSNAILKIIIAAVSGIPPLTVRVTLTFVLWGAAAGLGWWLQTLVPLDQIRL